MEINFVEHLLLLKDAKSLLGVTTKTIQKWDKEGKIKIIRTLGGHRRVPLSEIERLQGIKSQHSQIVGYARVSCDEQGKIQFNSRSKWIDSGRWRKSLKDLQGPLPAWKFCSVTSLPSSLM